MLEDECGPVRGIRLRTVSTFTMLFALACLAAFWPAGHRFSRQDPDKPARAAEPSGERSYGMIMREVSFKTDAGCGKRDAQKIDKSARPRAAVGFLLGKSEARKRAAGKYLNLSSEERPVRSSSCFRANSEATLPAVHRVREPPADPAAARSRFPFRVCGRFRPGSPSARSANGVV